MPGTSDAQRAEVQSRSVQAGAPTRRNHTIRQRAAMRLEPRAKSATTVGAAPAASAPQASRPPGIAARTSQEAARPIRVLRLSMPFERPSRSRIRAVPSPAATVSRRSPRRCHRAPTVCRENRDTRKALRMRWDRSTIWCLPTLYPSPAGWEFAPSMKAAPELLALIHNRTLLKRHARTLPAHASKCSPSPRTCVHHLLGLYTRERGGRAPR